MRKTIIFTLSLMMILSLTACSKDKDSNTTGSSGTSGLVETDLNTAGGDSASEPETTAANVKNDGYEKFSQLEIGMTESEVNAILGEPARVDKAYYYYNITVNGNETELQVWINTASGLVTYISGSFYGKEYRAVFADGTTDLSKAKGLESGEINTYDDCVEAFKTPGYLTDIDEAGTKSYLWVNTNDGHMRVTFRPDGTIKSYSGFY